ncbi:DUF3365 domain-containing protein [Pseudodesulfovibrio sp. zrk46]|uniref:c-type heme family protein n=1 Tax=Pseudodesulfovibrio sp. zrk46 TaxID=2725288 RepID=UPI00144945EB|nr:DUF3365 domain-containing protein [Pseudodesulfovibrio sp. zrk46]QJB57546.1 DUF3365 domain-containing protein [Pseudodesulfovibrio sp. zrk46]
MAAFGPKNLQAKFLLGLGTIVLFLGVFFASSLYFHLSSLLDSQVKDKADLVFSQVSSVQQYVREVLRPKMYEELPEDEFIIEAMSSSYISRAIMDRLNLAHSEYYYRRVAENARNPLFEVNEKEKELLDYFRAHPGGESWEGYRKVEGKEYFIKARPVVFGASCLTCHGVPQDSPPVLLDRYGRERGFGHKLDEVAGLVVVGVPVEGAVGQIRDATVGYAALYGGGMLLFFALVQMFFNKLIMTNLRRLTRKFRMLFKEDAEIGVLEKLEHGDEIEEVVQGLEELGDHVHEMHHQLRQHSENLEQMVEVRTGELQLEAEERRSDVGLFVQLLDGLNKSNSRREMWRYALPLIVKRFQARESGFVCMLASQTFYTWPDEGSKPTLPDNWKEILTECRPYYESGRAYIPVGASDAASEGILSISWDEGARITEQDRNVLRALGQQLGIAMENLTALHNLLRQKDMLQAIVEGISDPLFLMDGMCSVVLANEAARELAKSFGGALDEGKELSLFRENGLLADCPIQVALELTEPMSRDVVVEDGRSFAISVFPVAEGEEQEGRAVVYIRDVTQEKQMLSSMQQSEKLATVGQLAAGLAHEINNPLGVIKCYAELLKGAEAGQEIAPDAEIIIKHASQAENVLQELLNFARPKRVEPVRLDIGKALTDAVNIFRVQAEKKGVEIIPDVADSLPQIIANEQSVEQIFANLLKNALDAVEARIGRIEVSASMGDEESVLLIKVADNGPGVAEGDRKKLFDPFFSTKEVGKGTGLGLAVVYGLVQEMGGSIDVEADDGAVFLIRLPVNRERNVGGGK